MGNSYFLSTLVIWLLKSFILALRNHQVESSSSQVVATHCSEKCGNVSIPYPFGIEDGCYVADIYDNYKVICNYSFSPPKPYFSVTNMEVLKISVDGQLHINLYISFDCYNQFNNFERSSYYENWVRLATFTLSSTKNIFVAIGCDTYVWFIGVRGDKPYYTGAMTLCSSLDDVNDDACNGIGCTAIPLPEGVSNITTTARSFWNHSKVPFNPCSFGFPVEKDAFKFYKTNLTQNDKIDNEYIQVPVVFEWAVGTINCSAARANKSCLCMENAECYDLEHQVGYRCKCKDGFSGNPYLPQGCSDNDECKGSNDCEKPEYCVNDIGSYHCQCPKGYHGTGTKTQNCVSNTKAWFRPVIITAGGGGGIILLLVIAFIFHLKHGKRQIRKLREMYFQQNGGLLLYQKLSGRDIEVLKIFSAHDLEVATNNYADKFIIGRGGFGIVYKGILPNNQHVAIKRSLKVDQDQVEQFINEVIVLSQINNRNVVKLLGCCLETEVPLLVYEYITNGTLYEHLEDVEKSSILTWPLRLKIALDVANVLSYLHNIISTPIIHRDMKSTNILLDDNYIAKVADFGASRLVPEDQGQLTTMVLGTLGYLDPEYMQTSELTEKSDVYSFGVILVELITRKKAISYDRREIERCLAMHFLVKMKEGGLLNILDKSIVSEGTIDQIQQVANLAKWCLMVKGEDRPTMKEVAIELETINRKGLHPWNNRDEPFTEDCESLLGDQLRRTGMDGGSSSGIDSDLCKPRLDTTLDIGR